MEKIASNLETTTRASDMEKFKTFGLYVFVGSCIGLSGYLTANLCTHLRGDDWSSAPLAFGLIWEAGKIIFGSHVLSVITQRMDIPGHLIAAIALVTIGGSVYATVGYFLETDAARKRTAIESSDEFTSTKNARELLTEQIHSLSSAIAIDAKSPYPEVRGRVTKAQEQLNALQERHATLSAKVSQVKVSTTQDAMLLALNIDPTSSSIYWAMAVILDLFPLAALHIIRLRKTVGNASKVPFTNKSSDIRSIPTESLRPAQEPVVSSVVTQENEPTPVTEAALGRIDRAAGILRAGDAPASYAGLRKALRCSQEEVQDIFGELRRRGVVELRGNRHVVV